MSPAYLNSVIGPSAAVLVQNRLGNASTRRHRNALLDGPRTHDLRVVVARRSSTAWPAFATHLASRSDVRVERLLELLRVLPRQVDLVGFAVDGESNRRPLALCQFRAVQIIDQLREHPPSHLGAALVE